MNMSCRHTSSASLWEAEYARGGIPSSVREQPSHVLVEFLASPHATGLGGRALDIGCGRGRNALHLAAQGFDTIGFDYAASQVEALQARARPQLKVLLQDVSQPWPLADASIDFAADLFCFKHQIDLDGVATYVAELTRCLALGGRFILFFATRQDGYYARLPEPEQFGPGLIVRDPGNDIRSRLYDVEEVVALFRDLIPMTSLKKKGKNEMHGWVFDRESAVIYFAKPGPRPGTCRAGEA